MTMRRISVLLSIASSLCAQTAAADLPSFLRTENSQVRDGNEQLQKGDAKAALESYNHASHELPDAAGVQLDRGLALLKQGDSAKAREALLSATQPNAPAGVRADAYEDLSLAFYREAESLAGQNKHADAQKMFREALDASKRSLRLRPGDPNTAWNMELAARRIHEEDEKQKEEDEKEKQKQKDKDDKKQDDQKQDSKDGDDKQKSDPQKGDQKDQPQDNKDGKDKPQPKPEDGDKKDKEPQAKSQPPQDKQDKQDKPKPEQKPGEEGSEKSAPAQALPREAEQALDALEGSEENFERHRARQQAARERRAPEKDW